MSTSFESLKLKSEARVPTRAHEDDAGLDLYSVENVEIQPGEGFAIPTGIALALPRGFVGLVSDRSSLALKGLKTAGGVIDAGYRGEIRVIAWNLSKKPIVLKAGERVAQLLVVPISLESPKETGELTPTQRGKGGFGSTGL